MNRIAGNALRSADVAPFSDRGSDRDACSRFVLAVAEAELSRVIKADLKTGRFSRTVNEAAIAGAATQVGEALPEPAGRSERPRLVEVNLREGCVASPLSKYASCNTRLCRTVGLRSGEAHRVVRFMIARIGLRDDHRNIFDLLRYFTPTLPVPVRWWRRMIAFGLGDPTRVICSSLIAQVFQSISYPILSDISLQTYGAAKGELLQIGHHALFAPRNFDLSPWFEVVKPHQAVGIDHW